MPSRILFLLVLISLLFACDKVDNPDDLLDCVEIRESESEDDFGNLTLTIKDSTYVVPCRIIKRAWGSYDLFWYEYDETCFRKVLSSIGNFTYESGKGDLQIDSISYYCDPLVVDNFFEFPNFHYGLVDNDAPLGAYRPNIDLYDVSFEVSDYNDKRDIMRGSFSATLYLDQSCIEPSLRSADSVLVIQSAFFEAPVIFQ